MMTMTMGITFHLPILLIVLTNIPFLLAKQSKRSADGEEASTTVSTKEHDHPGLLSAVSSHKVCLLNTDCHLDLNERCIQSQSLAYTICGCGHAFVRNEASNVCEMKKGIRMMIKFSSLSFVHEYFRNNTPAFIRMKELAERLLKTVIQASKSLSDCVKDIKVLSFRPSSASSSNQSNSYNAVECEALIYITSTLYQSIQAREASLALIFVKEISVSVHELNRTKYPTNPEYDMTVEEIDAHVAPCSAHDLNYCSQDASCTHDEKEDLIHCQCKHRFIDTSPHPLFVGEVCSLQCPPDYCSNDGHCHVDTHTSDLYCTCNHWNVGARCQYDGIVVVSVLAVIVILLLLLVGCTASAFCSGRRNGIVSDHQASRMLSNYPNAADNISSHQHLVQAKPSLQSSSCTDEHVRPFRITIDNMNYGPDQHSAAPIIQFSPTSLCAPTHRDSCNSSSHPHHQQQQQQQLQQTSNLTSPAPSPRPSISAAVQTESLFDQQQHHFQRLSASSLEVAIDKPARGLRAPVIQKGIESRPAGRLEPLDSSISWC